MFIYSGDCRKGKCGSPTNMKDIGGNSLFVGDIVLLLHAGEYYNGFEGLTAVVDDSYISYSDGSHIENPDGQRSYIMGIGDEDITNKNSNWSVKRVKSYKNVVNGENWSEFGFNYKNY